MLVEAATSDSFKSVDRAVFVDALPESDFTANALLEGLPAGRDIFYRIRFQDLSAPTIVGEAMTGRFRTAPRDRRSISFVWSADTAGQGWGIDERRGGMRTYATMLRNRPDFFIHCGDTIYADGPILAEQSVEDVVTLPRQLTGQGELFMLTVRGDSMVDAAICDGDFVVVRRQNTAENGDIVAA